MSTDDENKKIFQYSSQVGNAVMLKNDVNDDDDDDDDENDEDFNPELAQKELSEESDFDEEEGVVDDDYDDDDEESKKIDKRTSKKKRKNVKHVKTTSVNSRTQQDNNDDDTRNKLEKIDEDKITSLWNEFDEFLKDVDKTEKKKETGNQQEKSKVVIKEYDFAGETVVVKEEVKVKQENTTTSQPSTTSKATSSESASAARPPVKRLSGGVSALLSHMKKPKMSTISKSFHDWNSYKKSANIEEECDQHRRSKNSFLERQQFLERSDHRVFEREKAVRDHERKMRQLNDTSK